MSPRWQLVVASASVPLPSVPLPTELAGAGAESVPSFDELCQALHGVRIVHHIRGRIRLKLEVSFALSAPRPPLPKDLPRALAAIRGLRSVRANYLARSCVVEYDPEVIPDRAWPDFLAGVDSEHAAALERILRNSYEDLTDAQL